MLKTHVDPATRMDGIVIEGRKGWSHVKTSGFRAEAQSKGREKSNTAVEIIRESDEQDEGRRVGTEQIRTGEGPALSEAKQA